MTEVLTPYDLQYVSDNGKSVRLYGGDEFQISRAQGLTPVTSNLVTSQGLHGIGVVVESQSIEPKTIIIQGHILGESIPGRKKLLDTIVPGIGGRLIYNNTWEIKVKVTQSPDIQQNLDYAKYHISLKAPNPYWTGVNERVVILTGMYGTFRFPVSFARPHSFGRRTQLASVNARNDGNVPSNFRIVFRATSAVINPYMTNVVTGDMMKLEREMVTGEMITIDMTSSPVRIRSIIAREESNIFGALTLDSVPFQLAVGDNIVQDGADGNPGGLETKIFFRDTYTGPW